MRAGYGVTGISDLLMAEASDPVKCFVEKFPNTDWNLEKPVRNVDFFVSLEWFLRNSIHSAHGANDDGYEAYRTLIQSPIIYLEDESAIRKAAFSLNGLLPSIRGKSPSQELAAVHAIMNRQHLFPLLETQPVWKRISDKLSLTQTLDASLVERQRNRSMPLHKDLPKLIEGIDTLRAAFDTLKKQIIAIDPTPFKPSFVEAPDAEIYTPG